MEQNLLAVASAIGGCGVSSGIFIWFLKAQIKNVTNLALNEQSIGQLTKELDEVKAESKEIKTNYLARFDALGKHVTSEVDRVIERIEEDREVVRQIQITCAANHGVMQ